MHASKEAYRRRVYNTGEVADGPRAPTASPLRRLHPLLSAASRTGLPGAQGGAITPSPGLPAPGPAPGTGCGRERATMTALRGLTGVSAHGASTASPKSATLTQVPLTSRFSGFTSRWNTPWLWQCNRPDAAWAKKAAHAAAFGGGALLGADSNDGRKRCTGALGEGHAT